MNFFTLVFKQMRQRALSTWLTLISVALGVALAVSIMILAREARNMFVQSDFGYDLIIGAKGSPLQLTLNTVYHIDRSPGAIPISVYKNLAARRTVRWAVPIAVGDNYKGQRIVATTPQMFGVDDAGAALPLKKIYEYRNDQYFQLAEGRVFHPMKFEAIIGSDIPQLTGLEIGDTFQASHGGAGTSHEDVHAEKWTVAGVLKPTHTANDHVLFIPLNTFYTIAEHGEGLAEIARIRRPIPATVETPAKDKHDEHEADAHEPDHHKEDGLLENADDHDHAHGEHDHSHDEHDHAHDEHKTYSMNADGTITLKVPEEQLQVSAVFVQTLAPSLVMPEMYAINNGYEAQAVSPAMEMREFFDNFLRPSSEILRWVSYLVTFVAAVSILVSIYNSVSARRKEIAILRALGASRTRVLTLICVEAGMIGLLGGFLGLVGGHLLGAAGSAFFARLVGEGFDWWTPHAPELIYLAVVVALATLAGLVPAILAYRTPVAENLTT